MQTCCLLQFDEEKDKKTESKIKIGSYIQRNNIIYYVELSMEVVYLFCESDIVRIPFFDYDKPLFRLLAGKGGVWDKTRHQFVFRQDIISKQLDQIYSDIPCVWVEQGSLEPIRIFGFLERSWKQATNGALAKHESSNLFTSINLENDQLSMPDKFSEHWQIKLETELRSRKYSPRTLRSYIYFNRLLCRTLQKNPEEIRPEDITIFCAIIEKNNEYSASSINLAISAIKFFYKNIFNNSAIYEQRRPRNDKRLPVVLSKLEIQKILSSENNIKHCLLLTLVYSSGLRVSEVVSLKKEHIDTSRGVIYIKLGKGRKDRCTLLSEKASRVFTEYCELFNIQTWVFPGQAGTSHLSIRSAQKIFDKATLRAKIHKKASIHSLRHTFATHLLENGTDIRYIQTLLGHSSLRTTERYTHIAQSNIFKIQSPLDSIV